MRSFTGYLALAGLSFAMRFIFVPLSISSAIHRGEQHSFRTDRAKAVKHDKAQNALMFRPSKVAWTTLRILVELLIFVVRLRISMLRSLYGIRITAFLYVGGNTGAVR